MVDLYALKKAAKINERALKAGLDAIVERNTDLEIVKLVERIVFSAKPAFPVNIGCEHIAAHYTPDAGVCKNLSGLVKLDAGVHVQGWITDAAITVDVGGRWKNILNASREALKRAIDAIKPGVMLRDVGKVIWETAKEYGVRPIRNLGGHQIDRYTLHAGLFVPNIPEGSERIEEGMILAIEPFMTNGDGYVREGNSVHIFSLSGEKARTPIARQVIAYVKEHFGTLPFALRWIEEQFGKHARLAIYELVRMGSLRQYPILLERRGSQVAQFETTVYVDKDGAQPLVDVFNI